MNVKLQQQGNHRALKDKGGRSKLPKIRAHSGPKLEISDKESTESTVTVPISNMVPPKRIMFNVRLLKKSNKSNFATLTNGSES